MLYKDLTISDGTDTFVVVDKVPLGYTIWNIGTQMVPGYLPLCRISPQQSFPGGRQIEADSLKAIKIEGAELILNAVGGGCYTIEEMERFIKQHQYAVKGSWAYSQVQRIKKALPIMRSLRWN